MLAKSWMSAHRKVTPLANSFIVLAMSTRSLCYLSLTTKMLKAGITVARAAAECLPRTANIAQFNRPYVVCRTRFERPYGALHSLIGRHSRCGEYLASPDALQSNLSECIASGRPFDMHSKRLCIRRSWWGGRWGRRSSGVE